VSDLHQNFTTNVNRLSEESRLRDEQYKSEIAALESQYTSFITDLQAKNLKS